MLVQNSCVGPECEPSGFSGCLKVREEKMVGLGQCRKEQDAVSVVIFCKLSEDSMKFRYKLTEIQYSKSFGKCVEEKGNI